MQRDFIWEYKMYILDIMYTSVQQLSLTCILALLMNIWYLFVNI